MDNLFNEIRWHDFLQHNTDSLDKELSQLNGNQLLNTPVDDLVEYYKDKFYFYIPKINEEEISVKQNEIDVDVSRDPERLLFDRNKPFYVKGTEIIFYIPFQGEEVFFKVQPSRYYMKTFRGRIANNCILYLISSTNLNSETIKRDIEQYLREIKEYLETQKQDSIQYNNNLEGLIRTQISSRRDKLLKDQNLVSDLGFKLIENTNNKTYSAPEVNRKRIVLPPVSSEPYKPEPVLLENDYENILNILKNMTHVIERSPTAFKNINEEALRMHFLVQLNGHYEGNATGETFNYSGKTDILIRSQDKNIFIAECKFWKGKAQYLSTIDQILNYASWRDTKVAILLFNRNKNLSSVIESIKESTIEHSNYKRTIDMPDDSTFKYKFSQKADANREITMTVMVFDVPK